MGINDLQHYLESASLEGGAVSVDLLKIARNVTQRQQPHNMNRKIRPIGNKLKLIVDAENCLDRLYGGYFSDWTCGGQWNRMFQFLSLLTRAIERGNIELAVVFNGTIENCRMNEWLIEQANVRQRVGMVLKHINTKGTPPPKIWWTPPTALRSALRMVLRHLGVTVMCTMDDHHQEVIAYCREYGFHGLLADDAEYAAFDPPRYFSAENLKLTYKGSLETKEYMLGELTKSLQLTQEQICIMAALLGNFLLPESSLQDLYKKIGISTVMKDNKSPIENNIKLLSDFIRNLPPPSNMDGLITAVFGSLNDPRASKFRQSVQYYLNGTASGFLKYCAPPVNPRENSNANQKQEEHDLDVSGFASETTEQEEESLVNYKLVTANLVMQGQYDLENGSSLHNNIISVQSELDGLVNGSSNNNASTSTSGPKVNLLVSSSSSNTSSVPSSPKHPPQNAKSGGNNENIVIPTISPDVLRTASLRHQKGLMAPMILHVLGTQEVRLPCLMEDEGNREFPPIHDTYRLLRKRVYAVLFNLHHLRYVHAKKKETGDIAENTPQPDVIVKEWIYNRTNPYKVPEDIRAEPLPWAVPTLQRLWFGPTVDDKRRRMRALLSCLNSDTPLILNTGYVPQHMLIMACVLRYIMSRDKPILRRNELDAFLCQAFNEDLMNPQYLQELTLSVVTNRGVQLAALFMEGVEMALLANDACGAPLPWLMCCPWLYFDGKLFHYTLNLSAQSKNILEVCENHIERVVKVERMRKAILEGLDVKFAKVPMPPFQGVMQRGLPMPPGNCLPAGMPLPPDTRMYTNVRQQRPISSRGGQLQVGGVVVGSWGANYGYQQNMRQQQQPQQQQHPQQMIGGYNHQGRGRSTNAGTSGGNYQQQQHQPFGRGKNFQKKQPQQGPPTFNVRRYQNINKKPKGRFVKNQEHTITVKTENGDVPVNEIVLGQTDTSNATNNKTEDCNRIKEHKGQGDAPVFIDTASN